MNEFELIERYFRRPHGRPDVPLGIGDDAALLQSPPGHELAMTTDTMVEAVHFPAGAPPHAVGFRALATNLSDLAAMGATPAWTTLALTLPEADEVWLGDFAAGFFELADAFDVALVGGDVTRGPLTITIGACGIVPAGKAMRRSGAQSGDRIFVTGALGEAAAGLKSYSRESSDRNRFLYPQPRVAEGTALREYASAAIDISDGLLADLGHLIEASGVGADLQLERIPAAAGADPQLALTGGDDYELCFTVPSTKVDALRAAWRDDWAPIHDIGSIADERGVRCIAPDGTLWHADTAGYQHFQ
ncbi:MAG TPA: thiamine-phosphate kinase [Gammaproteobacteria bacterium]|nr:thiamine-phosphate kinase [Gammaproteobacteria bacterium]